MPFQNEVSLRDFTGLKIGGKARYFLEAKSIEEVREALYEITRKGLPFFILGGGTNILVSDEGFPGAVIRMKNSGCEIRDDGQVLVEAGFDMPELVAETAKKGFRGLEWAGGLPGTVGGAIRGNAGCFGGEIKDVVAGVESLFWDERTNKWQHKIRSLPECGFSYRSSIFKYSPEIVISARLRLRPGGLPQELLSSVEEKIHYRRERHPLEYPNAGSIFKNIPVEQAPTQALELFRGSIKVDPFRVIPAAKVLAEAGLKGRRIRQAEISSKHPNFIVNLGSASDRDVHKLIEIEKNTVMENFGIRLQEEIQYVPPDHEDVA